jgi:hypothetical protein
MDIFETENGYTTEAGELDQKALDQISALVRAGHIPPEAADSFRANIRAAARPGEPVKVTREVVQRATDYAKLHGPIFRQNRGAQIAGAVDLMVSGDMTVTEVREMTEESWRTIFNWLTVPEKPGSQTRVAAEGIPTRLVREAKELVDEAAKLAPKNRGKNK